MYLKSLVLKGFKSFADRTVVNFDPGISAIVGPNGSGKSNISEAVLWVLGERKGSNLRVRQMEELIFSGSSARPAAKVAEVDLVLDNSDGTVPIEFNEVVITRRMHHNGESEYLMNGAPCLRRDIIDILHDSGIGEGVHSVITQGNLTAMIESRPAERLLLLEEAAGVLKHKSRKERASRQLAKMDDALARVRDIVKVIESQLRPLERQAARAQKFREYNDELRQLGIALAVDDLRAMQARWNQIVQDETQADAAVALLQLELQEKEDEVARRQRVLEEKGLFAGDLNEQRNRCQSQMARLDSNMRLLEEKGKNMVAQLSNLRGTIYSSQKRLAVARDEHGQTEAEMNDANARLQGLYAAFSDLNHDSERITRERREAQDQHNALASKLRNNESALATTKANLVRAQSSLESLDVEEQLLTERLAQIQADITAAQSQLVEQRSGNDGLAEDIRKAQNDLNLARLDTDKRVRLLDQARKDMTGVRDKLSEIQAEMRALQEIERAFEAASPSMTWITEHEHEFAGIVGRLSQVITAPPELEPLLERLLGADVAGVLVADMKSANLIAERLMASGQDTGEMTLLPLEANQLGAPGQLPRSDDGQPLIDLVSFDQAYAGVARSLVGDVYVCESIAQAVLFHERNTHEAPPGVPGPRYATRDGAVVWPNGKITLGSQISDLQGVLARQRQLNELAAENEACTANLAEAEMAVSEAEHALELAQQDGFEISENLAKLQGAYDSAQQQIQRLEQQIIGLNDARAQTEQKLHDVGVRRGQSAPLAQEYELRIQTLEADIGQMRDEVEQSSARLYDISQEKSQIAERVSAAKAEMETCRTTLDFRRRRIEKLDVEIAELVKTLEVSRGTERALSIIRLRVDPLYRVFEQLYGGLEVWAGKIAEQFRLMQDDSSSLREVIEKAKQARDQARGQHDAKVAELGQIRIEKAGLEAEVRHAIEKIEHDFGTSIEAALEAPAPEDRAKSEEKLARLRRKIESLGAVNHVAMEEYEALRARHDYIDGQMADLQEARKKLASISRALDKRMKRQFQETFDAVNASFKRLYEMLAPGDTGELVVLEKTEQGEGGIEIVIHPRGMKLTNLTLLSGGQSALVAIAFLFAIYMTRRAPFYILDEIEPSLDGTNLQRVCDLLESMRGQTQLIMVTHQRQTMEIADVLYGVSKQASGVSKLVSQRLEQAVKSLEQHGAGATGASGAAPAGDAAQDEAGTGNTGNGSQGANAGPATGKGA